MATSKRITREDKVFRELMLLISQKDTFTFHVGYMITKERKTGGCISNVYFPKNQSNIRRYIDHCEKFVLQIESSPKFETLVKNAFARMIKLNYVDAKINPKDMKNETNHLMTWLFRKFSVSLHREKKIKVITD